jgi:hypothetical protein
MRQQPLVLPLLPCQQTQHTKRKAGQSHFARSYEILPVRGFDPVTLITSADVYRACKGL